MKYYVKVFDEAGKKINIYNKYDEEIVLKVDENGFLKIPDKTFGKNGFPFKVQTNAKKVICSECNICELRANKATYIDCVNCNINYLEANRVEVLKCSSNPLDMINTPKAKEIECENCPHIEEINALQLEKLSCSDCQFYYTSMEKDVFPSLKELIIQNTNIKEIKLTDLTYLEANHNRLNNLELPNVDYISLMNEHYIEVLNTPNAKKISCINSSVETIICEKAQNVYLTENRFLKRVFADMVERIDIYDCDYIEVLEISKETQIEGITKTMESIFKLKR